MFLLIPSSLPAMPPAPPGFTFHYVSINTVAERGYDYQETSLHSTMFLLIHSENYPENWKKLTLHSTMFLLILRYRLSVLYKIHTLHSTMFLLILRKHFDLTQQKFFTFHYVSINTRTPNLF